MPGADLGFQCRMGASRARSARQSVPQVTVAHRDAIVVV